LGDRVAAKGVGFDDVGAGLEEEIVDLADHIGSGEREELVVALDFARVVSKMVPTEICFRESIALEHRPHGSIEHQDALSQQLMEAQGPCLVGGWA